MTIIVAGVTLSYSIKVGVAQAVTLTIDFSSTGGTILDNNGLGTGFTERLPGTGAAIPTNDPNLNLDTANGILELTTNTSDINGQQGMPTMEAIGIPLSELGFTGSEDFSISGIFSDIPASTVNFDQFGLYVGTSSNQNIRNGFLNTGSRGIFVVNNNGGSDFGIDFQPGLSNGTLLTTNISRTGGVWSVGVNGTSLTVAQPSFLNGQTELFVGVYGSNTASGNEFTINVDRFEATVNLADVPEPLTILGTSTALGFGALFKREFSKNKNSKQDS